MKSNQIKIEVEGVPGNNKVKIMHFSGELISDCVMNINQVFLKLIASTSNAYVIAEMSCVTSISSAALGEFMGCRKRLIEHGGNLVFSGIKLDIRTKLNMMGATKIFQIYTDVRSALNSYKWAVERKPEQVTLQFPPFLKIVPAIRQLVSRIVYHKGFGNKDSFRIETIIDELCNNAIEHGKNNSRDAIDLTVSIDPDKVEIDITNPSDPEKIEALSSLFESDDEEIEGQTSKNNLKRGRGLTLIKMLSDELKIDSTEKGTSIHIKKVREG